MKKHLYSPVVLFLLVCLSTLTIFGQAPEGIIYQAEARDSKGTILRNKTLDIKIVIVADNPNGATVWEGYHNVTTDHYGLFTLIIGEGTGGSNNFSDIDWANYSHFLNVQVYYKNAWSDMGTSQFLSVPYALHAESAKKALNDEVDDADSDPENEIQELILEGNILSISGGNSITLPESVNEGSFYFADHDGDGFGYTYEPLWVPSGTLAPQGYSENQDDCNDDDGNINPDAEDITGDEIDSDCDGLDLHFTDIDDDEDGYTENQGDCDDNDPTRNPGIQEICGDGLDQNCSGEDLDCNDLEGRVDNGEDVSDLIDEGFTIMELFEAGAGVGLFEQSGISQQELTDLGLIGTLADFDGNTYKWVRIGNQYWMAENLKTTSYSDGTPIDNITENNLWYYVTTSAYCWYNNDRDAFEDPYGALYNVLAVETGNLCPAGWHVPSDDEFTELTDYLGGYQTAGKKLKEIGSEHWNQSNTGTNETGFGAVPGGYRYSSGFSGLGLYSYYYSTTNYYENNTYYKRGRSLNYYYDYMSTASLYYRYGYSVRCIKDQ